MSDWKGVLRNEFDAEEGSFLLELRCNLTWDKTAFRRLIDAMQECAESHEREKKEIVDLWIAEGFWYASFFVKEWSTHEEFPQEHEPEYYTRCYERLKDLAFWFFMGTNPYSKAMPEFED